MREDKVFLAGENAFAEVRSVHEDWLEHENGYQKYVETYF